MSSKPVYLIIDPLMPARIIEKTQKAVQSFDVIHAEPKKSLSLVRNLATKILGVFINPVIPHPGGFSLIKELYELRPSLPLYLLYENKPAFTDQEIYRLSFQGVISHEKLPEALNKHSQHYNQHTTSIQQLDKEHGTGIPSSDQSFVATPIFDFLFLRKSPYDLYIRLESGKFLKILDANDNLDLQRIEGYLKKGAHFLYIRKAALGRQITYPKLLKFIFPKKETLSDSLKICETFNAGESILEKVKTNGLQESQINEANDYIFQIFKFTQELELQNQTLVQSYLKNVPLYDHAVSTLIIATLLSKSLDISSEKIFENVGLATLFHDVGLYKMPAVVQTEDPSLMSQDELELFKQHPEKGAEILAGLNKFDETVLQAIAQHHERKDGTGFPIGKIQRNINLIAEIIGLSDSYVFWTRKSLIDPSIDPLEKMHSQELAKFSYKLSQAFAEIFKNQQNLKKAA